MSEEQYIHLLNDLLSQKSMRPDRTGTGVWSLFGRQLRFSLKNQSLPLLTTKKVFFRGVVEELLWILRGETSAQILSDRGVKIWNKNATNQLYLRITGNPPMDIGPGYGFQLRNFGGEYNPRGGGVGGGGVGGGGVDQLKLVLRLITTDPTSRRIMWSYWNPKQQNQMCLPPCHFCYQFHVEDGKLSCMMTQRSSVVFLGLPFNIASTSLLTFILAKVCYLKPGEVIISIGDAHLYSNHREQALIQVKRKPYPLPSFNFKNVPPVPHDLDEKIRWIESLTYDNFEVNEYNSHASIEAPMAV